MIPAITSGMPNIIGTKAVAIFSAEPTIPKTVNPQSKSPKMIEATDITAEIRNELGAGRKKGRNCRCTVFCEKRESQTAFNFQDRQPAPGIDLLQNRGRRLVGRSLPPLRWR